MRKLKKYIKIKSYVALVFLALLTATSGLSGYLLAGGSGKVAGSTVKTTSEIEIEKSSKPELQFYVMSFCPYGNQIENVIRPVFDLIGDKADLKPQYIFDKVEGDLATFCQSRSPDPSMCQQFIDNGQFQGTVAECTALIQEQVANCQDEKQYIKIDNNYYTALHGRVEANQQIREICAWNLADNQKVWWDFVSNVNTNCTSADADTCWQDQAKTAGLDTDKITDCFNNQAKDIIEAEIALTTKNNVSASPTLLLNGVEFPPQTAYSQDGTGALKINDTVIKQADFRTPEGLKQAVCSVFNRKPADCKTTLETSQDTAAPSAGGC